jgi:glycerol-3-phosphate dehydrogenase
MAGNGEFDARQRAGAVARLGAGGFDVLIIGGGITGAGAALDAASRGLRVALVEARDIASGTSSRSSKLIHGGLRYLEQRDFRLVREALRERDLLVSKLAPHLVRPVPFLFPLYKKVVERPYVGAGLALYDAMEGAHRPVPFHRHLTAKGATRKAPALAAPGLAGAMLYYDAQVDDARYALTVARTAAAHGALIVTRASAESLLRSPAGAVTGARVTDGETGRTMDVTASRVVVCAGVWTDSVISDLPAGYRVRMSKGVHIVVPRQAIDSQTGMIFRTERSVLFIIPWDDRWIVGTTDTDWTGDAASVTASEADVSYLLSCANHVLSKPLAPCDVLAVYAGLRPLVDASQETSTTKLSREHVVDSPVPGLVTVAGGKFTTYRLMARDVIDAAVADTGLDAPSSVTSQLPLLGADGLPGVLASARRLAEDNGLPVAAVSHLIGRYGSMTGQVLDLVRADPTLGRPLLDGYPYLRAEVAYAVMSEEALGVDDVLARRTRLLIEAGEASISAAPVAATVMGGLLGWGRRRRSAEVRRYEELADCDNAALAVAGLVGAEAASLPPLPSAWGCDGHSSDVPAGPHDARARAGAAQAGRHHLVRGRHARAARVRPFRADTRLLAARGAARARRRPVARSAVGGAQRGAVRHARGTAPAWLAAAAARPRPGRQQAGRSGADTARARGRVAGDGGFPRVEDPCRAGLPCSAQETAP